MEQRSTSASKTVRERAANTSPTTLGAESATTPRLDQSVEPAQKKLSTKGKRKTNLGPDSMKSHVTETKTVHTDVSVILLAFMERECALEEQNGATQKKRQL